MFKRLLKAILLAPMTLIFGATGGVIAGVNETTTELNTSEEIGNKDNNETNQQNVGEQKTKTFTQAEVSAMMAKEKSQGKLSVLRELGVEDVKNAKEGLLKYQEYLDSQKSDLQKVQEEFAKEKEAREQAEKQTKILSSQIEAISLGVKTNCVSDVIAISTLKLTDDKTISDVIKELKTKQEYTGFFVDSPESQQNNGTGNSVTSRNNIDQNANNIGKRLGEQAAKQNLTTSKSSFFKN